MHCEGQATDLHTYLRPRGSLIVSIFACRSAERCLQATIWLLSKGGPFAGLRKAKRKDTWLTVCSHSLAFPGSKERTDMMQAVAMGQSRFCDLTSYDAVFTNRAGCRSATCGH